MFSKKFLKQFNFFSDCLRILQYVLFFKGGFFVSFFCNFKKKSLKVRTHPKESVDTQFLKSIKKWLSYSDYAAKNRKSNISICLHHDHFNEIINLQSSNFYMAINHLQLISIKRVVYKAQNLSKTYMDYELAVFQWLNLSKQVPC